MTEFLRLRRERVSARLDELRGKLGDAEAHARGAACVYVTGSFGRGEASQYSDLDLFIVGRSDETQRGLSRLDEILVKADLIEATRCLGFPEFSADGEYLTHHTVDALVKTLGRAEDDATNTFTARLLLLLESRPLIGEDVYWEAMREVVARYWRDYADHKSDFIPAFLVNDILRLWRTFCVNYEARTETDPAEKKAKRKLKNYKLKHSRLLTCYSALAYLLGIFAKHRTVAPDKVEQMVRLSPTERLAWLTSQSGFANAVGIVEKIRSLYEAFLDETDAPEGELVERFRDRERCQRYFKNANDLGKEMYQLINVIGDGNRFHQLLLV